MKIVNEKTFWGIDIKTPEDFIEVIFSLRARRIEFYEAVLKDYLANKDKYYNAM